MSRFSRWLRSRFVAKSTPYDHLLRAPRFQVRTEQLLGKPFRVADGYTFAVGYREIFVDRLYRFRTARSAPLIVDCGANCGLSVAYFKSLFPAAKIIAIEADPEIFELLKWNVASLGLTEVTLINKAVALGGQPVAFYREGADAGRIHRLRNAKARVTVPVVSLDELLREPVDFLKMDIEGAETDVLCASKRLQDVAQLMVEYHSFADAPQSLQQVLQQLVAAGFRYYVQTQFCPDRPLIEESSHLGMDMQVNIFAKRLPPMATEQMARPDKQSLTAPIRRVA